MNTREDNSIYEFEEKPTNPKSTNASMGIYIFDWSVLKKFLIDDENDIKSDNDFGKNIIPNMLNGGKKLMAYPFKGYWKDVGTIQSLWEANMDLLKLDNKLNLYDREWKIYSQNEVSPAHYIGENAKIINSLIVEGCIINGKVENSILSQGVYVGKNTVIIDSVIMPNVKIGDNVRIEKAIIGNNAIINHSCRIIGDNDVEVIGAYQYVINKVNFNYKEITKDNEIITNEIINIEGGRS